MLTLPQRWMTCYFIYGIPRAEIIKVLAIILTFDMV